VPEARLEKGLRLANALWVYWFIAITHQEGYDWLSKGLAIPVTEGRLLAAVLGRIYTLPGTKE
jgi:hypothetical protein